MASSNVRIVKDMRAPEAVGTHYRVLCMTGKNKGLSYFLKGKRVVMGRSENADIQVLDTKSSREHAELKLVNGNYVLTDLGSQNGVVVNDLKVTQHNLKDGDKVIIGQTVYKFSLLEVKDHLALVETDEDENDELEGEEDETKGKKGKKGKSTKEQDEKRKKLIMIMVVLVGVLFMLPEEQEKSTQKETNDIPSASNDVTGEFTEAIRKKMQLEEMANKKECSVMIQRGLRELREKNFFRAIEEFEDARAECVGGNADFYLNKARQNLDESIQENKIKAARETEALKYEGAIVSYCSIVRLLQRYPDDSRYKESMAQVRILEKKLGYLEGEIKCFER